MGKNIVCLLPTIDAWLTRTRLPHDIEFPEGCIQVLRYHPFNFPLEAATGGGMTVSFSVVMQLTSSPM